MKSHLVSSVVSAAILAATAAADTCSTVSASSNISVEYPLSLDYIQDQTEYWSTACGALKPTCIIAPRTAGEVAAIVTILRNNTENFAIKSGGHNPNNYFASIDGGPLISTKNLNEVTLDTDAETVRIGPGNRWDEVGAKLDGTGYTIVGGRIGNVGVGGYMLGGGLSFMSTEYGWAVNNVVEYEVVLADGCIVTASATQNPDLFAALKGSGNALGIVTAYTVKAYPQGQVWGGNYIYTASNKTNNALLEAVRDFTEYYPDEKAGIILTAELGAGGLIDIWVMFLYYNGPEPPAGVFDNFTAIGPLTNTCQTQSYSSLLSGNNWAVLEGSVYTIGTEITALPSKEVGTEVMQAYYNSWRENAKSVQAVTGLIASIAFQPLPKGVNRISKSKGGDLLDFDDEVDRIIFELDYSFLFNADYSKVDATMKATYGGLHDLRVNFTQEGLLPDVYSPYFMNDAYYAQDYFGRLKPENRELVARVQGEVDPDGLWAKRTGGFKL